MTRALGKGRIDGFLGTNPTWGQVNAKVGKILEALDSNNVPTRYIIETTQKTGGKQIVGGLWANPLNTYAVGIRKVEDTSATITSGGESLITTATTINPLTITQIKFSSVGASLPDRNLTFLSSVWKTINAPLPVETSDGTGVEFRFELDSADAGQIGRIGFFNSSGALVGISVITGASGITKTVGTKFEFIVKFPLSQTAIGKLANTSSGNTHEVRDSLWGERFVGTFASGFNITSDSARIGRSVDGKYWEYTGTVPFNVTAGTTPGAPNFTPIKLDEIRAVDGLEDELDVRAVHLTLAQAQASNLKVGQYVRLTDYGNALHEVVPIADSGGDNYLTLTMQNKLRLAEEGVLKISYFGVSRNIADDHTDAIEALITARVGTRKYVDFEDYRLRFTRQLNFNEIWVKSSGAELLKDFDGTGLVITGGSYYFRLRGDFRITGHGAGYGDGTTESTNGEANGVVVQGCRLDIDGRFESTNHQGNGFFINCNGNMNRSVVKQLHAYSNNVRGIRFTGTQDDASVWDIATYTYGNYEGGVYVDDDFQGRQWDWFCYNEASNKATGLYGVYIGKLRLSKNVTVYSEEQTLTGDELHISANCENLQILDMRLNRSVNNSPETCNLVAGNGGVWSSGSTVFEPSVRATSLLDNATRYISKKYFGSSGSLLLEDRLYGNSVFERHINSRSTGVDLLLSQGGSLGNGYKHYGTGAPSDTTMAYGGTKDVPTASSLGNIFTERHYGQPSDTLRELTRVNHRLDSTSGDRGVSSIEWATTNADLLPSVKMTLQADGVLNVPAGVTPFTGLHVGRSETPIQTGFAVDCIGVIEEEVDVIGEDSDGNIISVGKYKQLTQMVKVTTQALSKVCSGIVDSCVGRTDGLYDVYIAAVGDNSTTNLKGFRVCGENGDIEAGDLLCTSSQEGVLMKAPDTINRSVCVFKAMQDASFTGDEVLDVYGYL